MSTAVTAAQSLLQKYDVDTFPVPIESIARAEGVIITRKAFDGTQSGFALRDGQTRIIGVNSATSPRRQRFTIAHEMGHLDLHEGKKLLIVDHAMRIDWRNDVSSLGTNEQEIEANAFAAEILMPARMIRSQVSSYVREGITRDRLIVKLARDFDVSAEAMGYRLINLGILAS